MVAVSVCGSSTVPNVSPSLLQAALHAKWSSYKAQHGKEYASHVDNVKKVVFLENTRTIEEHNLRFHQGLESFQMGHNALSDFTLEEIQATRMGLAMPSDIEEHHANASLHVTSEDYPYPTRLDWRDQNAVGPVKNQQHCASCYAFSSGGALETAHWRRYGILPNVSVQHIVDCTRQYGNRGCQGGWMHTAFKWLQDHGGYLASTEYPYAAHVGKCRDESTLKIGRVARYARIPAGDEKALLDAVTFIGTIPVAYNAVTKQHAYYRQGILDVPDCGTRPTHAVLLVGYGTERGVDYWILKNSWGTSWGENGYFRMRRGSNMCGVANWASYPVSG
ncbi:cathepsin L1-like [Varroa destructor]|uniref:Uncharacterized protein n=1 Tax=Varroa destructor TaxID=109461 RepID=A0A7M7KAI4_VARDE|nr:cathepsin L1-like [Varroa destructor]